MRALSPPRETLCPFRVDGAVAGWLDAARARRLHDFSGVFDVQADAIAFRSTLRDANTRTSALARVAAALASAGELSPWRDERYAIGPMLDAPPWFLLERAAARFFGVRTWAVHINGIARMTDTRMWLARRSPAKAIDPGLLDNLVGGGVAAGVTVAATVEKEAWEEAGIPASLARKAIGAGTLHIRRMQPDGLQRETIIVHDLELPAGFAPSNQDGEAVEHRLVDLDEAARLVTFNHGPDVLTAEASLVVVDYLLRTERIARDDPHHAALAALRGRPDD